MTRNLRSLSWQAHGEQAASGGWYSHVLPLNSKGRAAYSKPKPKTATSSNAHHMLHNLRSLSCQANGEQEMSGFRQRNSCVYRNPLVWRTVNRFCRGRAVVEIRGLNKATKIDVYPMRTQDKLILMCRGAKCITVLNAQSFFYQWLVHHNAPRGPRRTRVPRAPTCVILAHNVNWLPVYHDTYVLTRGYNTNGWLLQAS